MNPVEDVVLLDGDTPHPESAKETSNNWDAGKLYYPSREHLCSVEISSDDIRCFQQESLLSSPIMNFYIMYLQGPMSSIIRSRGEYHIFNTYFFSKLEAIATKKDKITYFLKLRRWWKGVDIFRTAYIDACACRNTLEPHHNMHANKRRSNRSHHTSFGFTEVS
ncbi:hypothetical protein Zm00014a_040017 [Zea mays]|uniref:Ubiquitin-like protease family profile domain-containing protein n=1 Tax=Zea mays TaxID=4577 RepID=A0A3L6DHP3_MAIZE|nr:hypothetical protein Zm00014a_040017 [Zea mays]